MTIDQVIAHLKMLGFKKRAHESTSYTYKYYYKKHFIYITISKKHIAIRIRSLHVKHYDIVRTGHEQGLNYLVKLLYNLEQEQEQKWV